MPDTTARHRRAMSEGDPFAIVIYRPRTDPRHRFVDVDTGEVFLAVDRARYHRTTAYRERRAEVLARHHGCDRCGRPASILWAMDATALGCEDVYNTVALCRPCNDQAYRAREGLGLVA